MAPYPQRRDIRHAPLAVRGAPAASMRGTRFSPGSRCSWIIWGDAEFGVHKKGVTSKATAEVCHNLSVKSAELGPEAVHFGPIWAEIAPTLADSLVVIFDPGLSVA